MLRDVIRDAGSVMRWRVRLLVADSITKGLFSFQSEVRPALSLA